LSRDTVFYERPLKAGTVVIGCLGILLFLFGLLPQCALLDEDTFNKLTVSHPSGML
jgi:hypothetical protein